MTNCRFITTEQNLQEQRQNGRCFLLGGKRFLELKSDPVWEANWRSKLTGGRPKGYRHSLESRQRMSMARQRFLKLKK